MSDLPGDKETRDRITRIFKDAKKRALAKRKGERQDENTETHIKINIEKLSLEISTRKGKKKPMV